MAVSGVHASSGCLLLPLRAGGTFTDKLNRRCHYLVIQAAKGDKFVAAVKYVGPSFACGVALQH